MEIRVAHMGIRHNIGSDHQYEQHGVDSDGADDGLILGLT